MSGAAEQQQSIRFGTRGDLMLPWSKRIERRRHPVASGLAFPTARDEVFLVVPRYVGAQNPVAEFGN
jgi:hypothetical protein